MRGVNKVILVGTLGRDPETKLSKWGLVDPDFLSQQVKFGPIKIQGERKEQTEWHRIVLHNRLGELLSSFT